MRFTPHFIFLQSKRDAIKTIHASGGIAILPHPCRFKKGASFSEVRPMLERIVRYVKSRGENFDGAELFYPGQENKEFIKGLSVFAQENNFLFSGGSDYHGQNPGYAVGQYVVGGPYIIDAVYLEPLRRKAKFYKKIAEQERLNTKQKGAIYLPLSN